MGRTLGSVVGRLSASLLSPCGVAMKCLMGQNDCLTLFDARRSLFGDFGGQRDDHACEVAAANHAHEYRRTSHGGRKANTIGGVTGRLLRFDGAKLLLLEDFNDRRCFLLGVCE